MSGSTSNTRAGFTLVEILCVIAIIASLGAILYPAIVHAKVAAKTPPCITNLRQIGVADFLYAGDNDDRLPMATDKFAMRFSNVRDDAAALAQTTDISVALAPWIKDARIYHCPLDHGGTFFGTVKADPSVFALFGTSYYFPFENEGRVLSSMTLTERKLAGDYGFDWHYSKSSPMEKGFSYSLRADGGVSKIWEN